ncbi:phage upper tail fiber protein [Nocardia salmonicida]|uniref:phage upper tail fiber protein n=1 Tax=Nocardia salmonicida TaxID=53431 RepID=UPI00362C4335
MTILTDHFADIADVPLSGVCEIWRPELSPDTDGAGTTATNRVVVEIVDGDLTTPELDPGPARVMLRLGTWAPPRDIVIPDSVTPVVLSELFSQYEPQPPAVVSQAWQAAQAAEAARDEAVAVAEGIADIGEDVAQVAADRVAAEAARDAASSSASSAASSSSAAGGSASTATAAAATATAAASSADADAAAAEAARSVAVAARDAAVAAEDSAETSAATATTKAGEAAASAADAAQSAEDAAAAGGAPVTRTITGTGGLTGGGDLSADRTLSIAPNGVTGSHIADLALPQSKLSGTGVITDALAARELTTNRGVAGGYAALDGSGKVPAAQLPSYVDDVIEAANTAAFPGTGEAGKIYVAVATNKAYRWTGSAYLEISPSPGSTDSVAEGATNLYYTDARAVAANASAIAAKATDTAVVHLAGTETITGAKTFSSSPTVPAPSASGHAARKQDVDAKISSSNGTVTNEVTMTQAAYDALGPGRPSTTIYTIVG